MGKIKTPPAHARPAYSQLMGSPLFSAMSEPEFAVISSFLEFRPIAKDAVIFNEGDSGKEMFILLSGELGAYISQSDGTARWLFDIRPVDFFGEMSIIANEPRSATIVARNNAEVMVLRSVDFYRIVFEHPLIGIKMLRIIEDVQNEWLDRSFRHLNDLMRWGETARRRAITDELTGLYNRSFLEESIQDRFEQGSVGLRKMSLLMMDLDRVHEINERYGSKAGDRVLISTAEILGSFLRSEDISARLSGDEFAVLLLDADGSNAKNIADRIREAVSARPVAVPEKPGSEKITHIYVRTSIGIAVAPTHADSGAALISLADKALRRAKDLGRNRVELAG
jgi:diguanylate cyclase (GGDEF)-like protein